MNKIAIIGAGAAGLMAAITAAEHGADVTLFEQNGEPGKKILASGNGRCNIINTVSTVSDFSGEDPRFCDYALKQMDFNTFEKFCKSIGLLLDVKPDGRCYPLGNEARAVQSALIRRAHGLGVTIVTDTCVTELNYDKAFHLATPFKTYGFDKVLIATGSPAAPQLGGSDSGLQIAKRFGHTVLPPYPSLVGLHLEHPALPKMTGTKTVANVTLKVDGTPAVHRHDDILFTRYGISGFAVLDLSPQASKALAEYAQVELNIDLLPEFNPQSLAAQLEQMASMLPDDSLYDLLCGLLPHKLVGPLLKDTKIDENIPCAQLNAKTAKRVVFALKQWRFHVTDTHGFKHAEVAGGGVSTKEIDPKTMESKKVPGLYFAGEVIDIVGRRGGFNFHFAWAGGRLAGKAMAEQ